jgi:hypothetical protein
MPRGKQFCPYENNYFPVTEFKVIDGTQVHDVEPMHRATDGVVLRQENDEKVFPVSDMVFASPEEEGL